MRIDLTAEEDARAEKCRRAIGEKTATDLFRYLLIECEKSVDLGREIVNRDALRMQKERTK